MIYFFIINIQFKNMNIVTFKNKHTVVSNTEETIAEFSSLQDAKAYIINNDIEATLENIKEYPFYEVDEHGQSIG